MFSSPWVGSQVFEHRPPPTVDSVSQPGFSPWPDETPRKILTLDCLSVPFIPTNPPVDFQREEDARKLELKKSHLETLRHQINLAKEDGKQQNQKHHHHLNLSQRKGGGIEGGRSLHNSISRGLGQAKHHAQVRPPTYTRTSSSRSTKP